MTTTRELDRLTEGWPDDEGNFDLAVFAGTFRARRPELSAPALGRIADRLHEEMDRQAPRAAARPAVFPRLAATVARTMRRARQANFGPHVRRIVPMATAASVLLGLGLWVGYRPGDARDGRSSPDVPAQPTPVKERPTPNHIPPEGPQFPVQ